MNIQEAAKAMRADKWVRRRVWAPRQAIYITYESAGRGAWLACGFRNAQGAIGSTIDGPYWDTDFRLKLDDLEADDWEETPSGSIYGAGFDWRKPPYPAEQTCRCHGLAFCKELEGGA